MPRVKKRHVLSGIKVKEAMRRQVIKLPQSAPIDYCINRMIKYKINSVLLIDGKQRPVGIVSKTDIMSAFYAGFPTHTPVEDIMVGPPLYCYPDDELESSLDVMQHNRVHRLYVLGADASEVIGVLAYPDIVGLLYRYCRACDKGLLKTRRLPSKQRPGANNRGTHGTPLRCGFNYRYTEQSGGGGIQIGSDRGLQTRCCGGCRSRYRNEHTGKILSRGSGVIRCHPANAAQGCSTHLRTWVRSRTNRWRPVAFRCRQIPFGLLPRMYREPTHVK
jgi:CBS domain-containing protein